MGIYLNPGTRKFEIAVKSEIYVDKTELITETNKVLDTEQRYICVSRPRRFGKSITANMLAAYYGKGTDSSFIFDSCKIARDPHYKTYQNRYPVISLNMQDFISASKNAAEIIHFLEETVLDELKDAFPGILNKKTVSLAMSLDQIFAKTGEPFIFIIDEWDCLLREKDRSEK